MKIKSDFVIVGSGAGGATVAKELAKAGKKVLIIERGNFSKKIGSQRTALGFYDRCGLRTSKEGVIVYRTLMVGGTTVVSCGNGIAVLDKELKNLDIDLSEEFESIKKELRIQPLPESHLGKGSRLIMDKGNKLGLEIEAMPKFINPKRCTCCGLCVLGCKTGAKWSAVSFIKEMQKCGGKLVTGIDVKRVAIYKNKAIGLVGRMKNGEEVRIYANKIVLAAGGFGTPVILKGSGIEKAGNDFFADLFNVTYGNLSDNRINFYREPTMSVVSKKFLESKGFLISPFIDVPLVLRWVMPKRKHFKGYRYKNLIGIMTKIKDSKEGKVFKNERFYKIPTDNDWNKLKQGENLAKEIFLEMGIKRRDIFTTKPRGAHPGGGVAIGKIVDKDLMSEISNLFVCDGSVLPESSGAPPIMTIVALAKRLSKFLIKSS